MAFFPNSIFTIPTLYDQRDFYQASHQNIPYQELTAVMSSLGVNYTGSFATITSLWNAEHLPDGSHGAVFGLTVQTQTASGHYTSKIKTFANKSTKLENCTYDGSTFQSVNSSRPAFATVWTDSGELYFGRRDATQSSWITTSWTHKVDLIKTDGSISFQPAATSIGHALTTKQRTFWVTAAATINEDVYPLTFESGYARPAAADNTYSYAKIPLDLPNGVTLKSLGVIGATSGSGEIKAQCIRKDFVNATSILTTATATSGATVGSGSMSDIVVTTSYGYYIQLSAKVIDVGSSTLDAKIYAASITYTCSNMGQT